MISEFSHEEREHQLLSLTSFTRPLHCSDQTPVALLLYYWYAQRRCTFTLERNADFGRRAMLLNAEISGIPAAS